MTLKLKEPQQPETNEKRKRLYRQMRVIKEEFKRLFNSSDSFMNPRLTIMTLRFDLDIIALDDWLHSEHGYEEEDHGSAEDFIVMKFGKEAAGFIRHLLGESSADYTPPKDLEQMA